MIVGRSAERDAVEWFVRLRSPTATDQDRQDHCRWLSESQVHREAFEAVEAQWRELRELDSWAHSELGRLSHLDQRPTRRRRAVTVALAAVAALAAVTVALVTLTTPGPGDHRYVTDKGEQRRFVLEDGSRVHLNTASQVGVRFDSNARVVHLERGEGLFDVVHDPARPFVVTVDGNRIVAVGTRFNVYRQDRGVAVTVLEGSVGILRDPDIPFQAVAERGVLLDANTKATIDREGRLESLESVDGARLTAWDDGLLVFDQTPLHQVALEMSRYASGRIRVAHDVADLPVTGTIKIRDEHAMVEVLAEVIPIIPIRSSPEETLLVASTPRSAR
jgi:transmembrane sensor